VPHDEHSTGDETAAALAVSDVRLTYPQRRGQPAIDALRGVTLHIQPGQSVAMLGPNGSGKSTLMRVICGLLQPGSGAVSVFGASDLNVIRSAIGVVFQHTALDRHQTVAEALHDQARLYGLPRNEARHRVECDLREAGLADRKHQRIGTLSLGLARRVDLIRALLHRPRLLLLDEPTVGLDPTAREQFVRRIEQHREQDGLTVLLSTHLTDEADRQGRVVLLHEGQVVADDVPTALRRRLGSLVVTVHDAGWQPPREESDLWTKQAGARSRPLDNGAEAASHVAATLASDGASFTIAPPTLAHVFEHLTGSRLVQPNEDRAEDAA
jgi:ABC-2 type transport system ATP-binding protein